MKIFVLELLGGFAAFDLAVEWLNWRRIGEGRIRSYHLEQLKLGAAETGVQLLFWLLVFFSPILDILDEALSARIQSPIWQGAAWLIIVSLLKSALSLPFSYRSTFDIEERYGFNRTTPRTFWVDRLKGLILGLLLGTPVLALLLHFFTRFADAAWWMAWLSVTGLSLAMAYLAPMIILPLFNRYEPLPDGALKQAIEEYAKKEGFKMNGTFVMDGSKRSSKRNAFFTGFGRFKKLVLFDTLVQNHPEQEIVAIVAHEMGHFKLGHIPRMIGTSVATQGLLFWVMGQFLTHPQSGRWIRETFNLAEPTLAGALLLMSLLYLPLGRVLSILGLMLSRKHEFEADRYSRDTYGNPEALISALSAMQKDHLSHPNPHPLKVWLEYSHPTVEQRAQTLRQSQG